MGIPGIAQVIVAAVLVAVVAFSVGVWYVKNDLRMDKLDKVVKFNSDNITQIVQWINAQVQKSVTPPVPTAVVPPKPQEDNPN